jgi:hypothetical protein
MKQQHNSLLTPESPEDVPERTVAEELGERLAEVEAENAVLRCYGTQ